MFIFDSMLPYCHMVQLGYASIRYGRLFGGERAALSWRKLGLDLVLWVYTLVGFILSYSFHPFKMIILIPPVYYLLLCAMQYFFFLKYIFVQQRKTIKKREAIIVPNPA